MSARQTKLASKCILGIGPFTKLVASSWCYWERHGVRLDIEAASRSMYTSLGSLQDARDSSFWAISPSIRPDIGHRRDEEHGQPVPVGRPQSNCTLIEGIRADWRSGE